MFIAYIDFSKAYDRVPRNCLLTLLRSLGCGIVMLTALTSLFSKHSSSWVPDAIKIWGKKKYMAENKKGLNIVDDIEGQSKLTFLEDQIKHVERIYFAGGEPMMMDDHWYILELLKKHKRFDVRIMYNTNMARLDWKGKNVIDYWKLWEPGKIEIWPSLDEYGEILYA